MNMDTSAILEHQSISQIVRRTQLLASFASRENTRNIVSLRKNSKDVSQRRIEDRELLFQECLFDKIFTYNLCRNICIGNEIAKKVGLQRVLSAGH